jgi:hypothetical protein
MTRVACRSATETDTHFSIVFSFWKRSIDLIGKLFNEEAILLVVSMVTSTRHDGKEFLKSSIATLRSGCL